MGGRAPCSLPTWTVTWFQVDESREPRMTALNAPRIAAFLGGKKHLGREVRSTADLERLVREGIPYQSYLYLVEHVATTPEQRGMVEKLIVPRTTRLRREREGRLSREESERAERVARLRTIAEQVFESPPDAADFLYSPHAMLGGATPAELAMTDLGTRRVEDLLWKLEYSLPV